jgi:hypothetical protein
MKIAQHFSAGDEDEKIKSPVGTTEYFGRPYGTQILFRFVAGLKAYLLPPLLPRDLAALFFDAPFLDDPFLEAAFLAAPAAFRAPLAAAFVARLAAPAARPVTLRAALASFLTSFLFSRAALEATRFTAPLARLDALRPPPPPVIPATAELTSPAMLEAMSIMPPATSVAWLMTSPVKPVAWSIASVATRDALPTPLPPARLRFSAIRLPFPLLKFDKTLRSQ